MNYTPLFINNNTLEGENYICTLRPHSQTVDLSRSDYPVLFVLTGGLTLFCDGKECVLSAGEMVIAERKQITRSICMPNTIILEYRLPQALTSRFEPFSKPITPSIPISGRLETWVEECLHQRCGRASFESEYLIDMLVRYQSRRLRAISETMKFYLAELNWRRGKRLKMNEMEKRA